MNRQRKQNIENYHDILAQHQQHLLAVREDMASFFESVLEQHKLDCKVDGSPEGFNRRPTWNIQVQTDEGACLVVRPGWQPPTDKKIVMGTETVGPFRMSSEHATERMANDRNGRIVEKCEPRWLGDNTVMYQWDAEKCRFEKNYDGKINPETITLELRGPGKLLELTLYAADPTSDNTAYAKWTGGLIPLPKPREVSAFEQRLRTVITTCHAILTEPWETFKRSAALDNRCCCCHKELDVDESRALGIGPECIKRFSWFDKTETKYQQKYRGIDDPWEVPQA